jgi:hypothetical protein
MSGLLASNAGGFFSRVEGGPPASISGVQVSTAGADLFFVDREVTVVEVTVVGALICGRLPPGGGRNRAQLFSTFARASLSMVVIERRGRQLLCSIGAVGTR